MHDLTGPQELDDVVYVRVVAEPQDVVVGDAGLLLGGQILRQVGDQVTLDGHGSGVPRKAGGRRGVDARGVIHEIGVEAALLDVLLAEIPGQLMHNGADYLQMSQFLSAD